MNNKKNNMENQIYTKETKFGNFCLIENDLISNCINETGCWEYHLYHFYSNFIKPDYVIIDGGANIGFHSIQFAKLAYNGRVHSFEIQPFIFNILSTNFLINSLSSVGRQYLMGLGNDKINNNFKLDNISTQFFGNNIINYGGLGLVESDNDAETIKIIGIDSLNLERLDLIKLDVQGLEKDVLLGGELTIKKFYPILFLEAGLNSNCGWVREHGLCLEPDSEELFMILKSWGYTPYQIMIDNHYPGDTIFLNDAIHVQEINFIKTQNSFKYAN